MTTRVELAAGQWADIKDVDDLLDGDRKMVSRAVPLEINEEGRAFLPGDHMDRKRDAVLALVIENWSFSELALPSKDSTSLDRLTIKQAKALHGATREHFDLLVMPQDGPEARGSVPTGA